MENNNSVCFVARINEVKEIQGADNIELGVIGGWNCIIKKGSYKVDDLVIVATTDAVIPQELSDAMNVTNYLRKGQRVRTVKLRGVYSECLIIPIGFIPDKYRYEGADCMELMNIFKYEPPAVQVQLASGRKMKYHQNPNFGIYYKFPNIKNVNGMFNETDEVEVTRKIHGTNSRYGIVKKRKLSIWDKVRRFFGDKWVEYEYVYGSHNVEKGSDSQGFYDTDVWRTVAEKYQIREQLWDLFKRYKEYYGIEEGIVIYGEIYGPGIQKNYDYGLKEIKFAGFDVTINGDYCSVGKRLDIIKNVMQLPHVPILYGGLWSQEIQDKFVFNNFIEVQELTITDFREENIVGVLKTTKVPHEGIVIKALDGSRKKVAKVINPDYLIYGEKHNVGDSH
jgi:RNA ligase (TIGR02306 family)